MYLLNTFSRTLGSKDKKERAKRNLIVGASGGIIGAGLSKLGSKSAVNKALINEGLDKQSIKNKISDITKQKAGFYKNTLLPTNQKTLDLDRKIIDANNFLGKKEDGFNRLAKTIKENELRAKTFGKETSVARKEMKNILKTGANKLENSTKINRAITGGLLGIGTGILAAKAISKLRDKKNKK